MQLLLQYDKNTKIKPQRLSFDILPPATAMIGYAIGLKKKLKKTVS